MEAIYGESSSRMSPVSRLFAESQAARCNPGRMRSALTLAFKAHLGQMRISGEPFLMHPVLVATAVAGWRLDPDMVEAALLHDVMEDAPAMACEIEAMHGARIATLVRALTKDSSIADKAQRREEAFRRLQANAATVGPQLLLIKLADRAHNLTTSSVLPTRKLERLAQESRDWFAPCARELGFARLADWMADSSAWAAKSDFVNLMTELVSESPTCLRR